MAQETHRSGFVIDAMARTGSTTLVRLLNSHPDIRCLMEPFHPNRYEGQFHRMAIRARSVKPALDLIWYRWTGLKHVWEAESGWPFSHNKKFNDEIVLYASRVVFLRRRNLLRRLVSSFMSRQLNFWVGTQREFRARIEAVPLKELNLESVLQQIKTDQAAINERLELLQHHGIATMQLCYEDFYRREASSSAQLAMVNSILGFLRVQEISQEAFAKDWAPFFDSDAYQWASPETYLLIPGIEAIDREVGSDETGWLLR
ncbi:MAG TPA: hypothetical protein VHU83_14350 [Bryobacteraceae bacterium]|jgi:LPS sulfotransferase NodH|nr:hypothetical protein [Bryobacteraceae bacterium]